ncbi:ATP-grasp ribosomal peptide maturase [Streptomyces sp. SID13031]|uniref:ATP-grasp ribosomal peptide maturase n=1 Tax=Streptomyces sp. SID13031 TaxID=2706046 RepID=UPI0013CA1352|nr:ATP-grasp ribosomal peptide maturase [Streptomyces sp. SID13031]NEA31845.1 ATP-grasp ribosomal peptide maturase [Streptomyces sp. SID13031]
MAQEPRVLVVAQDLDPAADLLVEEFAQRDVAVMRFDLAAFPQRIRLVARHDGSWQGVLSDGRRSARLEHVGAVLWRDPCPPVVADTVGAPYGAWARQEAVAGLVGILQAVGAVWMNPPENNHLASRKAVQLPAASACGLRVPQSLITNDLDAANAFASGFEQVICKPLAGAQLQHAEGHRTAVPTHLIQADDLDESITLTAHYLQEWIPKRHEVRLIVVGDKFFPAVIHAGSVAAGIDWRTDYDALTYDVTTVPDQVRRSVAAWMRRFGLTFGAFDFAVTPDGEWVMFECNPAGQWGWIQDRTDLPISAAIAEQLIEGIR